MNVKELKKLLENCDDEDLIVLSSDEEGNNYQICINVETDVAYEDNYVYIRKLTKKYKDMGFTKEDVNPTAKNCIVFWP